MKLQVEITRLETRLAEATKESASLAEQLEQQRPAQADAVRSSDGPSVPGSCESVLPGHFAAGVRHPSGLHARAPRLVVRGQASDHQTRARSLVYRALARA